MLLFLWASPFVMFLNIKPPLLWIILSMEQIVHGVRSSSAHPWSFECENAIPNNLKISVQLSKSQNHILRLNIISLKLDTHVPYIRSLIRTCPYKRNSAAFGVWIWRKRQLIRIEGHILISEINVFIFGISFFGSVYLPSMPVIYHSWYITCISIWVPGT